MSRWLLIDIGNTHTVAGVSDGTALSGQIRFRTDSSLTPDEYRSTLAVLFEKNLQLSDLGFERAIISSVVPALDRVIEEALKPAPVLFICAETRRKFDLDLPIPEQLGADRLANVAGALAMAKPPFLIVDAGTATTFCLVDARPAYIGGALAPGLEIGWKALQSRAARLFAVELKRPKNPIGKTTETQIQSGVLHGYESLIEGTTDRILSAAGADFAGATLLATGGCTNWIQLSHRFRIEPDLTLRGLIEYGKLTQ